MPWKLILFLIALTLGLVFAGFNTTPIEISFGFFTFRNIPLFIGLCVSFLLGAFLSLSIFVLSSIKKKTKGTEKIKLSKKTYKHKENTNE